MGNILVLEPYAFVCAHVQEQNAPVLLAIRTTWELEGDSGWQFLCGIHGEHTDAEARIWALREVLEIEPSLTPFVSLAPGSRVFRSSQFEAWQTAWSIDDIEDA